MAPDSVTEDDDDEEDFYKPMELTQQPERNELTINHGDSDGMSVEELKDG